ncbi:MAG: bifunctional diguanylate cyclase/phosphodiesterase [Pontibacterium sp.]
MAISVVGYFLATTAVFLLAFGVIGYFWVSQEYTSLERDGEFFASEYLAIEKQELEYKVRQAKEYLMAEKQSAENTLRGELQERVNEAYALAQSLYATHRSAYSDAEIQQMIYAALKNMRFNDGRGYYFILDANEQLFLYPPDNKREQVALFEASTPLGDSMLSQMDSLFAEADEGFIRYTWSDPYNSDLNQKYSYVKRFEPFNWVIGTGDYLELFEEELKKNIFSRISQMTFGAKNEGYFFVNSYTGDLYVTNGQYYGGIRNIWDVEDANGTKVVQENARLAQENPDGAFSTYVWRKNTGETAEKISFILGMDEWQVFIGTGIYTDTLLSRVAQHQDKRTAEFKKDIVSTFSALSFTVVLIAVLYSVMTRMLSQNLRVFQSNVAESVGSLTPLNTNDIYFNEFKEVGENVNTMIDGLNKQSDELRHRALHDHLTALPNRRYVSNHLDEMLVKAARQRRNGALMFIDLDHFKEINDTLGHGAGDELLQKVSERFCHVLRKEDCVARLGGDEFTVVTGVLKSQEEAAEIAQELLDQLKKPFEIHAHSFYVTASVGISLFPQDGRSVDVILRNGDSAMYQAKRNGRNGFCFYDPSMTEAVSKRFNLLDQLNEALKLNQFELHYQPLTDASLGRVVGAEALIRWNHPQRGMVSPDQFIPYAEENGLINPIGKWVIEKALMDMKAWKAQGYELDKLSINFSTQQISPTVAQEVADILARTDTNAHQIEFEITESALMENPELSRQVLGQLSDMGIDLAIDDFGQGYSSLSYLKLFPISKLKIDRAFIRDIDVDENDRAIAQAIIALGRSLKLNVVAEGVENQSQLEFLLQENCHVMQGYFFSKPLPEKDFLAKLESLGQKSVNAL